MKELQLSQGACCDFVVNACVVEDTLAAGSSASTILSPSLAGR